MHKTMGDCLKTSDESRPDAEEITDPIATDAQMDENLDLEARLENAPHGEDALSNKEVTCLARS